MWQRTLAVITPSTERVPFVGEATDSHAANNKILVFLCRPRETELSELAATVWFGNTPVVGSAVAPSVTAQSLSQQPC